MAVSPPCPRSRPASVGSIRVSAAQWSLSPDPNRKRGVAAGTDDCGQNPQTPRAGAGGRGGVRVLGGGG